MTSFALCITKTYFFCALSGLIAGWGLQIQTIRRGSQGEWGRKEAYQNQLCGPALGVLWWGRGVPVKPQTPYLNWLWIQELSQIDTVNWPRWGHAVPEPCCLMQTPAHRGAKGCSPSCKYTHSTAQGHSPAEISPSSFQLLQISSSSVEKPFLRFITVEEQAGRGSTEHPHLFPGLLGQGKSKREEKTIRWFSWELRVQ